MIEKSVAWRKCFKMQHKKYGRCKILQTLPEELAIRKPGKKQSDSQK